MVMLAVLVQPKTLYPGTSWYWRVIQYGFSVLVLPNVPQSKSVSSAYLGTWGTYCKKPPSQAPLCRACPTYQNPVYPLTEVVMDCAAVASRQVVCTARSVVEEQAEPEQHPNALYSVLL